MSSHIWIHRPEEDPDFAADPPTTRGEIAWLGVLWVVSIGVGVAVVAASWLGVDVGGAKP